MRVPCWHASCFITGMIAASHMAPTASMNEASSASTNAHRDAGRQSFSDSLGAATKHAEGNAPAVRSPKHDTGWDKNGDADKSVKRPNRDQASSIDTTRLQQTDATDTNPVTIVLPTDFRVALAENKDQSGSSTCSSDADAATAVASSTVQGASWMNLSNSSAWSLAASATTSLPSSSAAQAAGKSVADNDAADDDAAQQVDLASGSIAGEIANAGPKQTPPASPSSTPSPHTVADDTDAPASGIDASAAAAQPLVASAQTVPVLNNGQQGAPSALSISAASASRASNAIKLVQPLKSAPKEAAPCASLPGVAKNVESFLSAQKEAKENDDSANDSAATGTAQHNDRGQAVQQASAAPVVTSVAASSVLNAHAHQPSVSVDSSDTSGASQQKLADPSLSSQLQQAATATPAASSDHLSNVVNSAKLMQSIGQSEMRVGMRTAEFGDISIRTSSDRDSISAQISLGHDDLAKTLTAHMPDMQTRLTTGEVVDVHIQSGNQDASFTGGQNSRNDGSAQHQQQEGGSSRSTLFNTSTFEPSSIAAIPAALVGTTGGRSSRLDIRA